MELLTGNHCSLHSFDEAHFNDPQYLQWVRDYEVIKTINKVDYLRPISFEEVKQYCLHLMQAADNMFFAIHSAEHFIGTLKVSQINWHNRTADLGILIGNKKYWGKGFASEAIQLICHYLFHKCGLRKLTAGFMATNPAMGKVFTKLGFVQEGLLREQDYFEGKYVDHIYMGCFADEFRSNLKG
jgi:ribosomal-protein-alanine N-acetyltransferase